MRRKYDTEAFYACCERLRAHFPGCALTADLICGFPGETEEHFASTLAFLEKCGFLFVHAFPYSRRPGTKAAEMPDQLTRAEKEERVRRANEVIFRMRREYLASQVGKTLSVLFEAPCEGHSENYCPVHTETEHCRNTVQNIQIIAADDQRLLGK